jgi:hypothetical protein
MELQKEVGHYLSDVFLSEYNLLLQIKSEIFKRPWVLQEPFVFSCLLFGIKSIRAVVFSLSEESLKSLADYFRVMNLLDEKNQSSSQVLSTIILHMSKLCKKVCEQVALKNNFHISKVLISNLRSIPYSEDSTECFLIAGIHKEIHIRVATFPVYNH